MYNEVEKGNLIRCLENVKQFCSDIVIYDDASTDNSVEVATKYTQHIIIGKENNINRELFHKQRLLDYAIKEINPDWFFWIDCDEILCRIGIKDIQEICRLADNKGITGVSFHELNLWRGENWVRLDSLFDMGCFVRMWKNDGQLKFNLKEGVHQDLFPIGLKVKQAVPRIIHYGFCYLDKMYKHIQCKDFHNLPIDSPTNWILNEKDLKVELVPLEVYPEDCQPSYVTEKPKPFVYTPENYKDHIIEPKSLNKQQISELYKREKFSHCYGGTTF